MSMEEGSGEKECKSVRRRKTVRKSSLESLAAKSGVQEYVGHEVQFTRQSDNGSTSRVGSRCTFVV